MAVTGIIFKAIKGAYRTADLPRLISSVEKDLQIPIVERFSGVKRYEVTISLAEAQLIQKLNSHPDAAKDAKKDFIKTLKTSYHMAKKDLSEQPATMADTAILGIAIKELALTLDDHVTEAYARAEKLELANQERSSQYLSSLDEWANQSVSKTLNEGQELLCRINSEADSDRKINREKWEEIRLEQAERFQRFIVEQDAIMRQQLIEFQRLSEQTINLRIPIEAALASVNTTSKWTLIIASCGCAIAVITAIYMMTHLPH